MSPYLPQEITLGILERLPPKSLIRFRAVCKTWDYLITDPSFICDHLNRPAQPTNSDTLLIFHRHVSTNDDTPKRCTAYLFQFYSLLLSFNQQTNTFSSETFSHAPVFPTGNRVPKVVGTCNGLVCVAEYAWHNVDTLIIWNPSLGKYINIYHLFKRANDLDNLLRYSANRVWLYGFGFDSTNMDYKVVRIATLTKQPVSPEAEIFSLASASWRRLRVRIPDFRMPYVQTRANHMFVNGAMHWLVCDRDVKKILSFDVVRERFGELMLPPKLEASDDELSVLGGGHMLALLHPYYSRGSTYSFSIWVMKEYGVVESWMEVWCCDSQRYGGIRDVLAFTSNGKVLMILASGGMVLLDPIKDVVKPLENPEPHFHAFAGPDVESLFFMNKNAKSFWDRYIF